jgi:hypothetical protein
LDGQRVTVLGRNRHPAFGIEIDCRRALKHGVPLTSVLLAEHELQLLAIHFPRR